EHVAVGQAAPGPCPIGISLDGTLELEHAFLESGFGALVPVVAPATPARPTRLAVLPFANLTGDAQQEYLSDGLTEEMIAELGRLPELGVIARTSVMRFKNPTKG